ncbi:MAG: DUF167 domain-containing protein [Acidimicrobiia bacterium]
MTHPVQQASEGCHIAVWVVPRASRSEITGLHGDAVRVRVAAAPQGGRANAAAAAVLSDALGGAAVHLIRGAASRRKVFAVDADRAAVVDALGLDPN